MRRILDEDCPRYTRAGGGRLLAAVVIILCVVAPASADPEPLSKEEQAKVDKAIRKGIAFLKKTQRKDGIWPVHKSIPFRNGDSLLAGWALLECGVPATDPAVERVVALVRRIGPKIYQTYELSLAILLLDRLGDPQDENLLQSLGLRLVAGQCRDGGWTYNCPPISADNQTALLAALRRLPPLGPQVPKLSTPDSAGPKGIPAKPAPEKGGGSVTLPTPSGADSIHSRKSGRDSRPGSASPASPGPSSPGSPSERDGPVSVPAALKTLTIFCSPNRPAPPVPVGRRKSKDFLERPTENSCNQFAALGLWVARRHGVSTDRSLALLARHLRQTQRKDGSWAYAEGHRGVNSTAMTCAGLVALALDPSTLADSGKVAPDPRVVKALAFVYRDVERPTGQMRRRLEQPGLYFLWSVKDVAFAYGLDELGDKDWYRWGCEVLVTNQSARGDWPLWTLNRKDGFSTCQPVCNTAFALLFLARSNPLKDRTSRPPFKPKDLNKALAAPI